MYYIIQHRPKPGLLLFLATGFIACCMANVTSGRYRILHDYAIQSHAVMTSSVARSRLDCARLCLQMTDCVTVSYDVTNHTCKRSKVSTWHVNYADLMLEAGIETFSVVNTPWRVWSVEGPMGRYSLSLPEAAQECARTNGRLISEDEMVRERSTGFELCTCGWMAERRNGFVLQQLNWVCWGTYDATILICNYNTADAYCV